jgi:hypothetical protein
MRLNRYQIYAFVRAVMQDVPEAYDETTSKQIQTLLVEGMSPLCRELYEINPNALASEWSYDYSRRSVTYYCGDADWKKITQPFDNRIKARKDFEEKLRTNALSCRTLKQLRERFPELVKYMPTEAQPTKNLPTVVNILQDLKALGWVS